MKTIIDDHLIEFQFIELSDYIELSDCIESSDYIKLSDYIELFMLRLSLWVAFICVSSLSLQYPKIVYLPQAVKSLLFPNQKRTQKFWKGDPIFNQDLTLMT